MLYGFNKFDIVAIIRDIAIGDIAKLGTVREIIDNSYVAFSARVERPDKIAANKSGTASYDDHVLTPIAFFFVQQRIVNVFVFPNHAL